MELKYLTVGINGFDIKAAEDALMELGVSDYIDKIREMFGVNIGIEDLREDYQAMTKFLAENKLKDENPFFNEFDINPYGLQISFNVLPAFKYLDILEPMVFVFGQRISSILKTECIVMFENMRVPAGLFKEGVLIENFENYNLGFFKNRSSKPNQFERS